MIRFICVQIFLKKYNDFVSSRGQSVGTEKKRRPCRRSTKMLLKLKTRSKQDAESHRNQIKSKGALLKRAGTQHKREVLAK